MNPRYSLFVSSVALAVAIAMPGSTVAQQCSGLAEIYGNDMVVTLGTSSQDLDFFADGPNLYAVWNADGTFPPHKAGDYKAVFNTGTLLHELGHNLSLCHNGTV